MGYLGFSCKARPSGAPRLGLWDADKARVWLRVSLFRYGRVRASGGGNALPSPGTPMGPTPEGAAEFVAP